MMDSVDQQRDIGKLWGAVERVNGDVKALSVALVGMNGDNGLRGELREFIRKFDADHAVRLGDLEEQVASGIAEGRRLYEVERHKPGECIGKAALDEYVAGINARERRSTDLSIELRKSRLAMVAAILVALISAGASVFVALQKTGATP